MKRCFPEVPAVCLAFALGLGSIPPAAAATPSAPEGGGTAPIEELYRLELLPRLRPGVTCRMFSSYDRTGGNNDGFQGTYSKLRVENGNSVLAEMTGPGCIQRIHLPHSVINKPGLLGMKNEHLRIFLDGKKTPALDVPLEEIFRGRIDGFPQPLVGAGLGGHYCYVPIPYRNGCKVEVEGTAVKFYAVEYRTFLDDRGIVTFHSPPSRQQRKALEAAVKAWSSCGDLSALHLQKPEKITQTFSLKAGESLEMKLPIGPAMVRAVCLTPKSLPKKAGQPPNLGDTRLEIRWDAADTPAADLPLDFFYCQTMQPGPFRSLLVGNNEQGCYNFFPMPYKHSGKITLRAKQPLAGKLTVLSVRLPHLPDDLGYFHADYHESLPTQTGKFHPWLVRKGRGHFAGVYLATDGQIDAKIPGWLEGDELFTCDGELRIHGTGTEDHFNCGWYAVPGRLNGPGVFPLHGFPVYRKDGERNLAAAFRWYLPDPVPYEKSIQAEIEHGGTNDVNANYRSAAFFYDAAP